MTMRTHELPRALNLPADPVQKKAPDDKTSIESAVDSAAAGKSPAATDVDGKQKSDVHSPKDASDKIASCEDKGAPEAPNVGKSAKKLATKKEFTPSPAVEAAIERCLAVRNASGSFIGWGARSEAAASASLALVAQMSGDYDALKFVRQKLNDERKKRGERALNKSATNELLTVYMCEPPKTKADRQECSRFANVILVAVAEKRTPENVGAWLKATTLSEVLEKARALKGKSSNKNYSVVITRSKYPEIWAKFKLQDVREAITKALTGVNKNLKKAASDAR